MRTHNILDALNDVDMRYLEEALGQDGKAASVKNAGSRRILKIGGICAAAAALGLAAMVAVPKYMKMRAEAQPANPLTSLVDNAEIPIADAEIPIADPNSTPVESSAQDSVPFKVSSLRVDWSESEYPRIDWITDVASMNAYIDTIKMWNGIHVNSLPIPLLRCYGRYVDGLDPFDDAFFAKHNLIFVMVEEPSGSNTVTVERVTPVPNGTNWMTLEIGIERNIPEISTCDMAGWLFLIEVDKAYSPDTCDGVKLNINTTRETGSWEQ